MQYTIRITTFLFIVVGSYILVDKYLFNNETYSISASQGTITLITMNERNHMPIKDIIYNITDMKTGEIVAEVKTDPEGRATTDLLKYGYYIVRQNEFEDSFILQETELHASLFTEELEFEIAINVPDYIKDYYYTDDGNIKITSVNFSVPTVLQLPELPNGCEITTATSILNYYGYTVSKTDMSDQYLPKEPFEVRKGKLFGPDPYKAYAGDPRKKPGGFFTYAPPVVEAVNRYIEEEKGNEKAIDISGSSKEEILALLKRGTPVNIWVTLDLSDPILTYSWYINRTDEKFIAPINLHTVVLHGYDRENVYVMNPLIGEITYNIQEFFDSYEALGSHAMIIK